VKPPFRDLKFGEPPHFFTKPIQDTNFIGGREYVKSEGLGEIRTVEEYPYSYTPYYIRKSREFSKYDDSCEWYYSDRMRSWDRAKYDAALDEALKLHSVPERYVIFERWSEGMFVKFVQSFFGGAYTWVATANGRNHTTGYDYYVFMVKKVDDQDTEAESSQGGN